MNNHTELKHSGRYFINIRPTFNRWVVHLACFSAIGFCSFLGLAQENQDSSETVETTNGIQLNELETKFKQTMTDAVFNGYWRLKQDGGLSDAKKESYHIKGITKITEKSWIVEATISYGNKNVTVPVPVNVEWADDTPVISVTRLGIPGLGTYSARVLVFDGCYSGVWSGPDYGGLLSGVIEKKTPNSK